MGAAGSTGERAQHEQDWSKVHSEHTWFVLAVCYSSVYPSINRATVVSMPACVHGSEVMTGNIYTARQVGR